MTTALPRPDARRAPAPDSEARLRASEESYRTIFELASDAIFVHDVETGAILDANRKACEMHDCTLDELKALGVGGISDGAPPYDEAHAQAKVARAIAGEPQRFEWLVKRRTGERFWVEVSLHRVQILGADRVLASVRNVDERKRAEAALRQAHEELEHRVAARTAELAERTEELAEAEARVRAIVEASPTPLIVSRIADGTVLYASGQAEALAGVGPGGLCGASTVAFYADPADRAAVLAEVRRDGGVRDRPVAIRRADGALRWVSATIQPFLFDGEPALASSLIDMTERRATEEALRERTDQLADRTRELEAVFRALPDLYFRMEADGTIRDYRAGRQFGLYVPPDAFLGRRVSEVLPPPVGARIADALAAVEATGEPVDVEYTLPLGDEPRDFEARLLPLAREGGVQVVAVVRDVTERARAQAALRESEEHFRRLIENATDLISIVDGEGRVRYQSPSVERVLGYEPGTFERGGAFDHLHPDDLAAVRGTLGAALAAPGTPYATTFRFLHADGSWRVLEATGRTLSPTSAEAGVVVNSRDVTERVEADRALRYQKALLEAEDEASIDGMLVVDGEGRIRSHNRRFAELWGLPLDVVATGSDQAALGAVLDQVADPDAFLARVADLYGHPDEEARETLALRDGRVFDRYTAPVRGRTGEHYGRIWFFRDVTEATRRAEELDAARRAAEAALADLRAAQARLVQQEKLAGLGRMAAGIAHELKNPLNFVTNFAALSVDLAHELRAELEAAPETPVGEALAAVGDLLDDLAGNAAKIADHGRRADGIVRAMMDHARVPAGARGAVDVNGLVAEHVSLAVDGWRARAGTAPPAVTVALDGAAGAVEGVAHELGRVVITLVTNALDAVAGAGGPAGVTVRTRRAGGAVEVAVEDAGPGVAEADRARVFEPFFTTKPSGEGHVGLGLSLARDVVVDGHGGALDVADRPGGGAVFTVTLPVGAAAEAA